MDNMQGKHNAGLFAAAPNVVASVPNAIAPIPKPVTPVTNIVPSVPMLLTPVTNGGASGPDAIAALQNTMSATDPDFVSHTTNFGLFTNTSAADPDDNEFVATVFSGPFFTDILTSGTDPSGSLGFGAAGVGVAGETVNTLETPFFDATFAIPVTDPLAGLFTALIPLGF